MPSHLPYTPTTPRSAASCAQTHPTRTDHGSWVLVSARKAHEPISPCNDHFNRFDVREWTRTESRVSAGSSTVAARNHGGGGPTTFTTHDELVQVRESRRRPSWLSHTAAAPASWTRLIAVRERRARATAVGEVDGRSIGRSDAQGPFGPAPPSKKPRTTTNISDYYRDATRERRDDEHTTPRNTTRHGAIRNSIARKPRDGDATPSLATTTFPTRASTRMRMRAGDDEAGARSQWRRRRRGAVQRNDGGGVVPETPHARRGARVSRARTVQIDRFCARSTTRRARYDGGGKGRDGGCEMPDGRRSCARGACLSLGGRFPPRRAVCKGCCGVVFRGRAANALWRAPSSAPPIAL